MARVRERADVTVVAWQIVKFIDTAAIGIAGVCGAEVVVVTGGDNAAGAPSVATGFPRAARITIVAR